MRFGRWGDPGCLRREMAFASAVSLSCALLDLLWAPLALGCAVRLLYVVRFIQKLEKATKTSPSINRSVQCLLVALPTEPGSAASLTYLEPSAQVTSFFEFLCTF